MTWRSAGTAFLFVSHRSVYASQKLGLSKPGGLEVPLDVPIGEVDPPTCTCGGAA